MQHEQGSPQHNISACSRYWECYNLTWTARIYWPKYFAIRVFWEIYIVGNSQTKNPITLLVNRAWTFRSPLTNVKGKWHKIIILAGNRKTHYTEKQNMKWGLLLCSLPTLHNWEKFYPEIEWNRPRRIWVGWVDPGEEYKIKVTESDSYHSLTCVLALD